VPRRAADDGRAPIEVGGIQAERNTPASASSAEAAAAVAVTADPKFTG
jgi:hypothetical protein